MEKYINQLSPYFTVENFLFFLVASIALTIILFLMKQVSKILALVFLFAFGYYFLVATPTQKATMKQCATETIEKKSVSDSCKKIF